MPEGPTVSISSGTTPSVLSANQIGWFGPGQAASSVMKIALVPSPFDGPSAPTEFGMILNRVGAVESGAYQGGIFAVGVNRTGRGKGEVPDQNIYRFILYKGMAILLNKLSTGSRTLIDSYGPVAFSQLNLGFAIDDNFTIPELEDPSTLTGPANPRQILRLYKENFGVLDPAKLIAAFTDPIYGTVYTTSPNSYLGRSFYIDSGSSQLIEPSIYQCGGAACFQTNGFFVFRPDGSYLMYEYQPDFDYNAVKWNDGSTSSVKYTAQTIVRCKANGQEGTFENIVTSSSVNYGVDITPGGTNDKGDVIYLPANASSSVLDQFYSDYAELVNAGYYRGTTIAGPPASFANFLATRPIYFWYDPFGRLVRFENKSFLPLAMCEPVIYLYPTSTMQAQVRVNPLDGLIAADPAYGNGWSVTASSNGAIYDPLSQTTYPYLFWEGLAPPFPISPKGYVVQPDQIHGLFLNVLPKLGLDETEARDFMTFWEPKLQGAPYYFITFYTNPFVDSLAPLDVSPKPDTLIRVLMDFEELQRPVAVQPLQIVSPQRKGFTVVEWGGIERSGWMR